jgi:hypothetical protein
MTRLWTIALLAAVCAAGCFGRSKAKPPVEQSAGDPPAAQEPTPDVVTTAEAMVNEFLADPKAAGAKYEDKLVEIEGRVEYANPNKAPHAIPLMGVKSPKTGGVVGITCYEVKDMDKFWGLGHGQKVKVVGRFVGYFQSHLRLEPCTIMSLEPNSTRTVRARRLTAEFASDEKAAKQKYVPPGQEEAELVVEGVVAALTQQAVGQVTKYAVELEGQWPYRVVGFLPEADWRALRKGMTVALKCDCRRNNFPDLNKGLNLTHAFVLYSGFELKEDLAVQQPPPP